ncbi:hypothetical protein [Escherichia coli]|uniref:hypothetical protein n=1 Tax=Escherichia coli TaxID=562 RepID=UPI000F0A7E43|nr:hypothetical protein [Escherichia coli]MBB7069756.1 hypothetical protein [Escherichia coli]
MTLITPAKDRFTVLTVPRALSRIHRITKFTLKKGGRAVTKQKLIPPKVPVPTNKHGDVVAGLSFRRMVNLTTGDYYG